MNRRRGFTLVELLVVITVIGILTSVLMPSVQFLRENANRVVCRSNLRQLAVAVNLYKTDHAANFPPCYSDGPAGEGPANPNRTERNPQRQNPLFPEYLNDLNVLVCPSCRLLEKRESDGNYYSILNGMRYYFYEYNAYLNRGEGVIMTPRDYAKVILYFDQDDMPPQGHWTPGNHMAPMPGGHILFCDGHVEWINDEDKQKEWNKIDRVRGEGDAPYGDYL